MLVRVMRFIFVFFFFKQKTAYEMRISDWSSDVCSSDLDINISDDGQGISFVRDQNLFAVSLADGRETQVTTDGSGNITCGTAEFVEIGRASCRERVCQYV